MFGVAAPNGRRRQGEQAHGNALMREPMSASTKRALKARSPRDDTANEVAGSVVPLRRASGPRAPSGERLAVSSVAAPTLRVAARYLP